MEVYEFIIVGGGVHGVVIANHLIGNGCVKPEQLQILDPRPKLLEAIEERFKDCGTQHLRSRKFDHVGFDRMDLQNFLERNNRLSAYAKGNRPCVKAWVDHGRDVVQSCKLESIHTRAWASGLRRGLGHWDLLTSAGVLSGKRIVFALGLTAPAYPEWALRLRGNDSRITHVFDRDYEQERLAPGEAVTVVGGGITGAQVVCTLLKDPSRKVRYVTRRPIGKGSGTTSSDAWYESERRAQLCQMPYGERDILLAHEGDRGTIPDWELEKLEAACVAGTVTLDVCDIAHVDPQAANVQIVEFGGRSWSTNLLILATGFYPIQQDWLTAAARKLELPFLSNGYPELEPSFEWQKGSGLFLSGPFAKYVAGPFAGNISGARIAAAEICRSLPS